MTVLALQRLGELSRALNRVLGGHDGQTLWRPHGVPTGAAASVMRPKRK